MKYTGYVRQIDHMGRIVLPMDLRVKLNLQDKSKLEIIIDKDLIVMREHTPSCVFCGGSEELLQHGGKNVCAECIETISRKAVRF